MREEGGSRGGEIIYIHIHTHTHTHTYTLFHTVVCQKPAHCKVIFHQVKLNIEKTKIMLPSPITSWQTEGEKMETDRFYFLRPQNHCEQ